MKPLKTWLTVILALQLLLAGSLLGFNLQRDAGGEPIALISDVGNIDRVEIKEGDNSISLVKQGEQWVLPEHDNLPATESKILATLESVAGVNMVWPVSATGSSHERFEVAEDNYQRDITLYAGEDAVAHFYLGTSPGFRKVHLRQAGVDEVYAVNLNTFDFPVAADEWLEKSLLTVADADRIEGPDFTVQKNGEDWSLANTDGNGEILNTDKAQQLAVAFSNFRIANTSADKPTSEAVEFSVSAGDTTRQFKFYTEGENYFVQREDVPHLFTLSKYDFERLAGIKRESLLLEQAPPAGAAVDTDSAPGLEPDSDPETVSGSEQTGSELAPETEQ